MINIKRKILYGLGWGVTLSVIGLVVGLIIGMNIGGNHYSEFEFMGGRGYEVAGYLGALIGLQLVCYSGFYWALDFRQKEKRKVS